VLIHMAAVVGDAMKGQLPHGDGVPLVGGVPPDDRAPGGEL
jgi:hypothetical protein